ncbi:hypothetical protein M9Y90_13205 [Leptospira interrogans]|uniref:Uncharacterized protein n=2 Tax=Leptospira interrogans TaxID=173 RepID=A0AAP9W9D3_LEPIR|nr:hypothetical protein [Leptospira interrogans]MBE0302475.1 hypothetical protein [Leptospira interrogans serovar Yeoncheon]MCL8311614.1 hypothetical protein [Leptospira interrogans]QOI41820.1 hypothetical protein Lepto782_05760 [Leptospira interrogans serovar Canicola]QOI51521.1 hypothetical protein Lepto1489_14440 [Leptospira interrogans serovar Bataviae]
MVKAENHRGICFNPLPLSQEKEIAAAKVQIYELEKALLAFLDIRIANPIEAYYTNIKQNCQID